MFLKKSTLRCIVSACDGGDIDIHFNITGCRHNFVSLFFQHFQNGNLQKCTNTLITPCLSASVCHAVCVTTWETLNVFAWSFIFVRLLKICHHIPHLWLKLDKITGVLCKTCMCFIQLVYLRSKKCWTEFVERIKQQGVHVPSLLYCVYIAWCFDVLLTVHLSIFILIINQLDAQNLFYNKFISCLYIFRAPCVHRQEVRIVLYSLWYHHTWKIHT